MIRILSIPMFIASSISFIFFLFFLLLIYKINKSDKKNNKFFSSYIIFLILSLLNSIYDLSFGVLVNSGKNLDVLDITNRITIISGMFVMVLFIHFIKKFFDLKYKGFIFFFYVMNAVFSFFIIINNPLFLYKEFYTTSKYYTGLKFGILFQAWGIYFFLILIYAFIFLFYGYRKIIKEENIKGGPSLFLLIASFSWIIVGFIDALTAIQIIDLPPLSWIGSISIVTTIAFVLIIAIEELYKKVNNLYNELIHDNLTLAYSKSFFEISFKTAYENLNRTDSKNFLVLFDIDDFKKVNDTIGHLCGDYVLKKLIIIVKKHLRINDILARFGGDEFLILITDCDEPKSIIAMIDRLRETISKNIFILENNKVNITCSFGIASFDQHVYKNNLTYEHIFATADIALYKSKESGKNMITMLDSAK